MVLAKSRTQPKNSLLHFKHGFSNIQRQYSVIGWIKRGYSQSQAGSRGGIHSHRLEVVFIVIGWIKSYNYAPSFSNNCMAHQWNKLNIFSYEMFLLPIFVNRFDKKNLRTIFDTQYLIISLQNTLLKGALRRFVSIFSKPHILGLC